MVTRQKLFPEKIKLSRYRSSHRRCSVKMVFLKILQNSQENCRHACNFIKKETLAQVFSCEFCEISKNIFLQNTPGQHFRRSGKKIQWWYWYRYQKFEFGVIIRVYNTLECIFGLKGKILVPLISYSVLLFLKDTGYMPFLRYSQIQVS